MTVEDIEDRTLYCSWFDGPKPHRDTFDFEVVSIYTPPKKTGPSVASF
jgi:uncharacterized protein YodC (DUF2158 family)